MRNGEELDMVMVPRDEYIDLICIAAIYDTVKHLVSNTSYVSRHDLLLLLRAKDNFTVKESEEEC